MGAAAGMAVLGSFFTGVQEHQMEKYLKSHFKVITKEQKKELKLIYSGVQTTSKHGLDVKSIQQDAKNSSYLGLRVISIASLVLVTIGFLLVFLERQKKVKLKEIQ